MTPHLTVNYGLRYDTTFGLFTASGRSQVDNPALLTLRGAAAFLLHHRRAPRLPQGVRARAWASPMLPDNPATP